MFDSRNFINVGLDEEARLRKSPAVEGTLSGAKAAIIATPLGAAFQAIQNKNPYKGALLAGLGAGLAAGAVSAAVQKYKNLRQESDMRYHLRNLVDREPTVAMPNPDDLRQAVNFSQGFNNVYTPNI